MGNGTEAGGRERFEIPMAVVRFDDDAFKRICNELGRQGVLEQPNRTTHLTLEINAGKPIVVTEAEEDG